MKKHSLNKNGLSISQAQSASNLAYQGALEIDRILNSFSNCEKYVTLDGERLKIEKGNRVWPTDKVIELIQHKSKLHALQAFLMENIKVKEDLIKELKNSRYIEPRFDFVERDYIVPELEDTVEENWGWEQLSLFEYNEYLEVQAHAAHIGKFIHNEGKLTELRRDIQNIPELEWIEIKGDGSKIPVKIEVINNSNDLNKLYIALATLHRDYEQRVNYFKAKVKNLVSTKNSEIARKNNEALKEAEVYNQEIRAEYNEAFKKYREENLAAAQEFERTRQEKLKEISALRIEIDARFQETLNLVLGLKENND